MEYETHGLTRLIREDMKPALGVTEPGAIAYAVARAREQVQGEIRKVYVALNSGMYKNAYTCGIPNSSRYGSLYAAALGAVAADAGKGLLRERDYQDVDGLVTDVPGITLVAFFADCVPLFILDPVHRAIGLSHSGWRGSVNRIGQETLDVMGREYGTRAGDVVACIGPSICRDCFEVGPEVAEQFSRAFSQRYWPQLYDKKGDGKYQLDLWRANQIIFTEAGVRPENIHTTDICTRCNPRLLFSHRAMGERRGNLAAFLCLM